jgi:hypothetical protein
MQQLQQQLQQLETEHRDYVNRTTQEASATALTVSQQQTLIEQFQAQQREIYQEKWQLSRQNN